jgi:hypothetical protein
MKRTDSLTQASSAPGKHLLKTLSAAAFARLLAQEYIRNGMNVAQAYMTLTGCAPITGHALTLTKMTRGALDEFVDEIKVQLAQADIELERVLAQLWAMLQTSVLDFFGEDGKVLPVRELKKLPRCMQAIVLAIDVKSVEQVVNDTAGNVLMDDNGVPYLRLEQRVRITLPNKIDAHRQLAALMKWTGPQTVVNNFNTVNIGVAMASADDRRRRMERVYEADAAPVRAHPDDPAA